MEYFKPIAHLSKSLNLGLKLAIPTRCALCNCFCTNSVCEQCQTQFKRNTSCCSICADPMETIDITESTEKNKLVCGQCLTSSPPFETTISPYIYTDGIRSLVHQFKYSGDLNLANFFATSLAEHLSKHFGDIKRPDLIIPIPLHKRRLKQRGYNQAQLLANALSKVLSIPCLSHSLIRTKPTVSQTGLNKALRLKNIKGAFKLATNSADLNQYSHIMIVDDVITTGVTINEAGKLAAKKAPNCQLSACSIARPSKHY